MRHARGAAGTAALTRRAGTVRPRQALQAHARRLARLEDATCTFRRCTACRTARLPRHKRRPAGRLLARARVAARSRTAAALRRKTRSACGAAPAPHHVACSAPPASQNISAAHGTRAALRRRAGPRARASHASAGRRAAGGAAAAPGPERAPWLPVPSAPTAWVRERAACAPRQRRRACAAHAHDGVARRAKCCALFAMRYLRQDCLCPLARPRPSRRVPLRAGRAGRRRRAQRARRGVQAGRRCVCGARAARIAPARLQQYRACGRPSDVARAQG
jgi:hypothetical protein